MNRPIPQPLEGAHPAKADVPGDLPTSATAGDDKGEPDDGEHHFVGEASLTPEREDRRPAESAEWEPPDL